MLLVNLLFQTATEPKKETYELKTKTLSLEKGVKQYRTLPKNSNRMYEKITPICPEHFALNGYALLSPSAASQPLTRWYFLDFSASSNTKIPQNNLSQNVSFWDKRLENTDINEFRDIEKNSLL